MQRGEVWVVVAAGPAEVGFSDHLQELRGDQLGPLEGLGSQPGFSPELDERCRVAYTWVDRDTESLDYELRVWDPDQKTGRALYRSRPRCQEVRLRDVLGPELGRRP